LLVPGADWDAGLTQIKEVDADSDSAAAARVDFFATTTVTCLLLLLVTSVFNEVRDDEAVGVLESPSSVKSTIGATLKHNH
jgi:hypothetical protein